MKYDSGMTYLHTDIAEAINRTVSGNEDKVRELAADASPVGLREFLKEKYASSYRGNNLCRCTPQNFMVYLKAPVNNNGDTNLYLSWSQVSVFIRNNLDMIFGTDEDDEEEEIIKDKNALELFVKTFDESAVKCPHWIAGKTLDYKAFGGVEFECSCITRHFCELSVITNFLAGHCHNHTECRYYKNACDEAKGTDTSAITAGFDPETAVTAAEQFNYAVLSAELGDYLRGKEQQLRTEYMSFTAKCGEIFAEAQERLAKNGFGEDNGLFRKWIESMGFKKDTVYRMISIHNFRLSQIATDEQEEIFGGLQKSLQYEIAKPSAPPQLVEQVLNGDITKHAEYIKLKKQLEENQKHYTDVLNENQTLRGDRATAMNRADNAERTQEKLRNNITKLENEIRELKSRPVDVIIKEPDETEILCRDARIQELELQLQEAKESPASTADNITPGRLENIYELLYNKALDALKDCRDFIIENVPYTEVPDYARRFRMFHDRLDIMAEDLDN